MFYEEYSGNDFNSFPDNAVRIIYLSNSGGLKEETAYERQASGSRKNPKPRGKAKEKGRGKRKTKGKTKSRISPGTLPENTK